MTSARPGAHLLVECLLAEGVDTLFGIPGVGTISVYDTPVDHPALRHIELRHEQAANLSFNDRGYGVERRHQGHLYGRRSGVDLLPLDFVAVARASKRPEASSTITPAMGDSGGLSRSRRPCGHRDSQRVRTSRIRAFGTYERK